MKTFNLIGHSRPLTSVQFNRDGDLLFSAAMDGKVCAWHTHNVQLLGSYDCGGFAVSCLDCSLDSKILLVASKDQKIFGFNVEDGTLLFQKELCGPARHIEWCQKPNEQDRFLVVTDPFASYKTTFSTFKIENDDIVELFRQDNFNNRCYSAYWGPFDLTIITCHESGHIMVWDSVTCELLKKVQAHEQHISCLSFTEDRCLAVSACVDFTAKLWNMTNLTCLKVWGSYTFFQKQLFSHVLTTYAQEYKTDRRLNACAISPLYNKNGYRRKLHILVGGGVSKESVTTTGGEGKFHTSIFHMVSCEELAIIKKHFGPINTMAYMPNGEGFATGAEDGTLVLYKFDDEYFSQKFK